MPISSPIEPTPHSNLQSDSGELEDIFADGGGAVYPTSELQPLEAEPTDNNAVATDYVPRSGMGRRRILIIATCVLALLLLGGGGLAVWLWLQARPVPIQNPVVENTNNTNVVETNTNVVTVPETPTNTNPVNSNINTQNFVDVDHDGLSDEEELVVNTNPKKKDTDEDGLSDREEVRVYTTDPRNPDTDGDGYNDGDEVTNFYHPNHPDPKKRLFDLPQ